jgi:peptidylamidoglycolate lyase
MRTLLVSLLVSIGVVAFFSSPVSLLHASRLPQERNQRGAGGEPKGGFVEERGGFDISGPYEVDPNWPKKTWPAPGYIWGSQGGVFPESADRVFLVSRGEIELPKDLKLGPNFPGNWGALNRGGATGEVPVFRNTILVVDRQGNLLESWKQWDYLFEGGRGPHQVYVQPYDPERHVWIVDDMNHVIHKFTNDGKTKVFTLGEMGVFGPNDDLQHFNRPTMIDWLPDGTFFVSDGYANSRVVKFNKDGKPLLWWGSMQPGKGDGEFTVPHGIAVGDDRRVYVSDRFNRRIQVFDENGVFLDKWPSGYCHSLSMSRDQHLWCYDGDHEQFVKFDLRGHIETIFGRYGTYPGATWGVHQISADSEGNLYAAEVFGGRTQKFVPKPNANPHDLFFGRELAPKTPVTRISTVHLAAPIVVATAKPNPNTPIPNFTGTWNFDKSKSQMAASGGMGNGVAEPPAAMTITQNANQISIAMKYESDSAQGSGGNAARNGRPTSAVFTLDGKMNQVPDAEDPRPAYNYKRIANWDGARLVLRTIHGLNNVREVWVLEGNVLKSQRAAQTPGGADSATRDLLYNKGS